MSIARLLALSVLAALAVPLPLRAGDVAMPGLDDIPLIVADVNGTPIYRHDLVRELVGSCGAEALDRLDYFTDQLNRNGIYVNLCLLNYRPLCAADGLPKEIEQAVVPHV